MAFFLSHDEHQFIASAKLLADQGLMPYIDYPYFHMPYLVFLYALIFKFCGHLLFSARMVSVLSSFAMLLIVFRVCLNIFRGRGRIPATFLSLAFVSILLNNPLFVYANNLSWNHALPTLLTMMAFFIFLDGIKRASRRYFFMAGLLVGTAVGIRLSFVLLPIPFMMAAFFLAPDPADMRQRKIPLFFIFGFFLSLLPAVPLYFLSDQRFIFGNLISAKIHTLYWQATEKTSAITLFSKFRFIMDSVLSHPNHALLVFSFLLFLILNMRPKNFRFTDAPGLLLAVMVIPFLFIGALVPAPMRTQYLYTPFVFLFVGLLYGFDGLIKKGGNSGVIYTVFFLLVFSSNLFGEFFDGSKMYRFTNLSSPCAWIPVKVHRTGRAIASLAKDKKILTLAPIYALEGNAQIYKEFITGPFAWRSGCFLDREYRKKCDIICPDDLPGFLNNNPPGGILIGVEEEALEKTLIDYAEKNHYQKAPHKYLSNYLWISP